MKWLYVCGHTVIKQKGKTGPTILSHSLTYYFCCLDSPGMFKKRGGGEENLGDWHILGINIRDSILFELLSLN